MADSSLPVGDAVEPIACVDVPRRTDYIGEFVTLSPVNPQADVEQLFAGTHGSAPKEQVWTYLPYGPFAGVESMQEWLAQWTQSNDPLFFTVHHHESQRRVGMVSFVSRRRCDAWKSGTSGIRRMRSGRKQTRKLCT